jgi:hypothetical protein
MPLKIIRFFEVIVIIAFLDWSGIRIFEEMDLFVQPIVATPGFLQSLL